PRLAASDFVLQEGLEWNRRKHPDFSAAAKPLQFGFVLRDTDPKGGHHSRAMVDTFRVLASGAPPSSFPFADSSFNEGDWTVQTFTGGSADWAEQRYSSGGNPGKYLELRLALGDRSTNRLIHLSRRALYDPGLQGALASVDI